MKEFPPPKIDGRRRSDLREAAIERARSYTPELDPTTDDVGTALFGLFAEIAEDVTERLDRTPEKHRVAFFDELGFDRHPPQPARLPLVFEVADPLQENVAIPSGIQAVSEPEGDEAEQTFEIAEGEGFEATPARLKEVYSVHPDGNAIFEHQAGSQTDLEPRLFAGENQQSHVLYLGHSDFFSLTAEGDGGSGGIMEFDVRIVAPREGNVFEALRWSYYGTREVGGESVEDWHRLNLRPQSGNEKDTSGSRETILRFTLPAGGEFVETMLPKTDPKASKETAQATGTSPSSPSDVTEIESNWIKCEPPTEGLPQGLFDVRVERISLSLPGLTGEVTGESLQQFLTPDSPSTSDPSIPSVPGTQTGSPGTIETRSLVGTIPDTLLANDIPLPTKGEEHPKKIYPFGEIPRPLDAFYVGSEEVLTKKGQRVLLVFLGMENTPTLGTQEDLVSEKLKKNPPPLNLSWEYWNGSGWDYLPNVKDNFTAKGWGWVEFDLPRDADATTVAGHESHWIRVRVLEDGYVRYVENKDDSNVWEMLSEVVPRFDEVRLFYKDGSPVDQSASHDGSVEDGGSEISADEAAPALITASLDQSISNETSPPLRSVRDAVSTPPEYVVAYNNLSYSKNEARMLRGAIPQESARRFIPFKPLSDETQAVYLGFDRQLDDGWIQVLFSSEDKTFPDDFYPRARWEYCEDGSSESWVRLSTRDGTDDFKRRGIVGFIFPESTTACELFGRKRHWVRARLGGDQFLSTEEPVLERNKSGIVISEIDADNELIVIRNMSLHAVDLTGYRLDVEYDQPAKQVRALPSRSIVPPRGSLRVATGQKTAVPYDVTLGYDGWVLNNVDPDTVALLTSEGEPIVTTEDENDHNQGGNTDSVTARRPVSDKMLRPCRGIEPLVLATSPIPTKSPPVLRGVYINAGWADNVQTMTSETVGSSDGEPNQEFSFANQPVTDETVWIEELSALSEDERDALKDEHPEWIEEHTDDSGEVTAFWVQWTRMEDFVGSGADDRHYILDRIAGRITFGNGTQGRIPPHGEDNIRADYRTGGGVDGNVREDSVAALTSSLPFVESVTNPEPGAGGANAETKAETLQRASQTLRDRNRAVTRVDFERLAKAASRGLERVRCIPGVDRRGASRIGWVTVLLVPRSSARKPIPSPEVKARVEEKLRRHAPAPLTGPTSGRIVVRGPSYIEVTVDTDLVASDDVSSIAILEETATRRLEEFLHPLTGSQGGTGWSFGELPCISDFYALLEGVEGVDHVERLEVTFRGRDRGYSVTDDDRLPEVTEDTLVFSGVHEIQATSETIEVTDQTEGIV